MDREPTATVAVAGGKGGCGKTTTTLGVASALPNRGRSPVAVGADVDLPDLHIRAGVAVEPGLTTAGVADPTAALRESPRFPGVDVLPAGAGEGVVGPALSRVAALDRPVLLDCPAGAGPDAAAPLRAAAATLLVCSTGRHSRADARKTATMARALDAPPSVRVSRRRSGASGTGADAVRGTGVDATVAVRVPAVDGRPLERSAVLDAFDRVATAAFPPDGR